MVSTAAGAIYGAMCWALPNITISQRTRQMKLRLGLLPVRPEQ
jgi:hypothetical protein